MAPINLPISASDNYLKYLKDVLKLAQNLENIQFYLKSLYINNMITNNISTAEIYKLLLWQRYSRHYRKLHKSSENSLINCIITNNYLANLFITI